MTSPAIKALLAFGFALGVYIFAPSNMPAEAQRVLFVFVVAALFWAFEIIPLFATSLLVILLQIFFLSLPSGGSFSSIDYKIFLMPFGSPIIILFFGGFVLAAALHKYGIDRYIATRLIRLFGQKPYFLLAGFMLTTAMLSMWMSDTATTVMMIAMALPLLKQLDADDPFRTALILAIPFSGLIGGMCTPVGTPPNAIAIGILADYGIHLGFITWMKMALPLGAILLVISSFILYFMFPSQDERINFKITIEGTMDKNTKMTIAVAGLTIFLWLSSGMHHIPSAVVALLAAGIYAATGLLDRSDFRGISWDILILMWGGLALGRGMELSGLTKWIISLSFFQQEGFVLVAMFCVLAVLLSTFMSNTATANLLIPIVMVIPGENTIILATVVALSCSLAMVLPVSTPPNAIAFSTDMLKSKDMIKAGLLISVISVIIILAGFKIVIPRVFGI